MVKINSAFAISYLIILVPMDVTVLVWVDALFSRCSNLPCGIFPIKKNWDFPISATTLKLVQPYWKQGSITCKLSMLWEMSSLANLG